MQGGFLRLHIAHRQGVMAEDLDGAGHLADLVLAGGVGAGAIEIAFGQTAHGGGEIPHRGGDAAPGNQKADKRANGNAADRRKDSNQKGDGGRLQRIGTGGGQRFARIGAVDLDGAGDGLLRVKRLGKRRLDGGSVLRVGGGNIDHGADFAEIGFKRRADRLQLLELGRVGGGLDLRQARQHFRGALVSLFAEIGGFVRPRGQLVGHAADGDDIDAQVHGLTGNLFPGADRDDGRFQRQDAACTDGCDDQAGQPHDENDQTDLLENGEIAKIHVETPAGQGTAR